MKPFLIICAAIIFWPVVMYGGGAALLVVLYGIVELFKNPLVLIGVVIGAALLVWRNDCKKNERRKAAEIKRLLEMDPEWRARELAHLQSTRKSRLEIGGR